MNNEKPSDAKPYDAFQEVAFGNGIVCTMVCDWRRINPLKKQKKNNKRWWVGKTVLFIKSPENNVIESGRLSKKKEWITMKALLSLFLKWYIENEITLWARIRREYDIEDIKVNKKLQDKMNNLSKLL